MKRLIPAILFALLMQSSLAQNSSQDWATFIRQKEKGPMVITSNLYYNFVGKPNYKNLLIVGTTSRNCKKNGYPDELGLSKFYMLSDSIAVKLDQLTKKRLVGIVTYQCSGLDIYYIKDTTGVKNTIKSYLEYNYALSKNYLLLEYDKKWQYYKENLIPKDVSERFFINHDFLNQLVIDGDNLTGKREISHWINFLSERRRQKFLDRINPLEFSVDSMKTLSKTPYKYQVKISRKDSINPKSISHLTGVLEKLSVFYAGRYDGWGIAPIKKEEEE